MVKAGGELSMAQVCCVLRLRYMSQGAVIGTKAFVGEWGRWVFPEKRAFGGMLWQGAFLLDEDPFCVLPWRAVDPPKS